MAVQCSVLGVSRSGDYSWLGRPESQICQANRLLSRDCRDPSGQPGQLRQPPHLPGASAPGPIRRPAPAGPPDAKRWPAGQEQAAVQGNHGFEACAPRGAGYTAPGLYSRGAQSALSFGHHLYLDPRGVAVLTAIMDLYSRGIVGWSMAERLTE